MVTDDDFLNSLNMGNAAAMATQLDAERMDFSGVEQYNPNTTGETFYNEQDPQTLKAKAQLEKAKNNGVDFKPPSNGRMLFDMLGSLLVSYGAMRLFGAEGNEALGVGLTAAGLAHDKDKQEVDRYSILQQAIAKNGNIYSPEDLWNFMKTGDGKGMEAAETRKYNREDVAEAEKNKREDAQTAQDWKEADNKQQHEWDVQDKAQTLNNEMTLARYNQGQENARAALTAKGQQEQKAQQVAEDKDQMNAVVNGNIDKLINGADSDLSYFANPTATTPNEMGVGAAGITSVAAMKNPKIRELYDAAIQVNGNRLVQNVAAAKAAGASGINTEGEVKLYNANAPSIDFSSPSALKRSLGEYRNYVNGGYRSVPGMQEMINQDRAARGLPPETAPSSNAKQVEVSNRQLIASAGQPSTSPNGSEITNGKITLKVVNGKWEVQD